TEGRTGRGSRAGLGSGTRCGRGRRWSGSRRNPRARRLRGRRRRRGQRERTHALRNRRTRVGGCGRGPHSLRRIRPGFGTGADLRARAGRRRRPGVRRRLDAPEGRNGAEARPEHDLDSRDDPARQDLRRPDDRRRRDEREAPHPCPPRRRVRDRSLGRGRRWRAGSGRRQREDRDRLLARRHRRLFGDGAARARRRQRPRGAAMRLGVSAALVDGRFVSGDVEVADGTITGYGLASRNGRGIAAPGFVDLQVNGFGGVDLLEADADGFRKAGDALLESGVTSYLPTFITGPEEHLLLALRELPRADGGPRILGVHLEGPFLASTRLGTHPPAWRRDPDPALLERLIGAGPVRLVTLAPELPGAEELIDLLQLRGITVSCGHTDATADEADAAFDRGIRTVTHLFNAMRPLRHRDPGLVGAALAREDVVVHLIVDGIHLADVKSMVVWRAAAGRVALVTDAIAGAGAVEADGASSLGGFEVVVRDGIARGPDGVLAGSLLTMIEAVRNLHELGAPLEDALTAATAVPARVIAEPNAGRLAVGLPADLIVLDDSLEIERVLLGGAARVVA